MLARWLNEQGIDARVTPTAFEGEINEVGGDENGETGGEPRDDSAGETS